ncbi:peptide chain release factor N(5)-glutamine methyltransferase [Robiginitomaculum antarcticum]|uniref:peptide chain release factor N(5)-glutamine methyltransferase n=1 Tax=Robiginitomaculum antarcticum TaxID=437507 RepID=UPI00037ED9B3|nr:peptide chain release factor N(5)-glutamine methyltransferase [Robiginitomaculum antarcticum]
MEGLRDGVTIRTARTILAARFKTADNNDSALDARRLVGHVTGLSDADMIAQSGDHLTETQIEDLRLAVHARLSGKPIDLILGYRDFWLDRFIITADVLSPRPETEGVIEAALRLHPPVDNPALSILELGVGSGALILSLLREYAQAKALAVDISAAALSVARENGRILNLNCDFIKSDWFENVEGQFDLIVSNPPYISGADMAALPSEVALHDPRRALYGGEDGLGPYRIIAAQAGAYLTQSGSVILEIGNRQAAHIRDILHHEGFDNIAIHADLAGHDRIVTAKR